MPFSGIGPPVLPTRKDPYHPLLIYSQPKEVSRLAVALSQAERCTAEMRSLTSELGLAQPALRSAAEAEDATAAACARCTPALLRESAALKQHLAQSLEAAGALKAQLPHLHMVAADLKIMSAQVIPVLADVPDVILGCQDTT